MQQITATELTKGMVVQLPTGVWAELTEVRVDLASKLLKVPVEAKGQPKGKHWFRPDEQVNVKP